MKIKSLVMASVLALASLGALAQTVLTPQSLTFSDGYTGVSSGLLTATNGSYSQTYSLTGLGAGQFDLIGDISGSNLVFSSVTLNVGGTPIPWTLTASSLSGAVKFGDVSVTNITPVTLTVVYTKSGNANYSGSMTATAAVPEPETYAMLLAGLGLMGSIVRRRNNANTA